VVRLVAINTKKETRHIDPVFALIPPSGCLAEASLVKAGHKRGRWGEADQGREGRGEGGELTSCPGDTLGEFSSFQWKMVVCNQTALVQRGGRGQGGGKRLEGGGRREYKVFFRVFLGGRTPARKRRIQARQRNHQRGEQCGEKGEGFVGP